MPGRCWGCDGEHQTGVSTWSHTPETDTNHTHKHHGRSRAAKQGWGYSVPPAGGSGTPSPQKGQGPRGEEERREVQAYSTLGEGLRRERGPRGCFHHGSNETSLKGWKPGQGFPGGGGPVAASTGQGHRVAVGNTVADGSRREAEGTGEDGVSKLKRARQGGQGPESCTLLRDRGEALGLRGRLCPASALLSGQSVLLQNDDWLNEIEILTAGKTPGLPSAN